MDIEIFQGGSVDHVFKAIDLTGRLEIALLLLRNLGGAGLVSWKPSVEFASGLAVCELSGDGLTGWEAILESPACDPEAEILAGDEEYDGGHYLTLREPPLVLAKLDGHGRPDELVGLFMGTILWVHPDHRGQGGGRKLIVAAADARDGLPLAGHWHSNYSAGGLASVQAAFREIAERHEFEARQSNMRR